MMIDCHRSVLDMFLVEIGLHVDRNQPAFFQSKPVITVNFRSFSTKNSVAVQLSVWKAILTTKPWGSSSKRGLQRPRKKRKNPEKMNDPNGKLFEPIPIMIQRFVSRNTEHVAKLEKKIIFYLFQIKTFFFFFLLDNIIKTLRRV